MKRKREVVSWTVNELYEQRGQITFPEYQRESNLWPEEKKSLLIDSILMDIDIPKLYFNEVSKDNYEVVDGQQRLWAIWDFLDGTLEYKNATFDDLTQDEKDRLVKFELQVTTFQNAEESYLRELFVRLQFGLLLNPGEKLHAATGEMKTLVFDNLVQHPFVRKLGIPKRRFAKETLCAQIAVNSFSRAVSNVFARTRYEDLLQFFRQYAHPIGKDLQAFKQGAKRIAETLNALDSAFGESAQHLKNRSYILSIYLLYEDILEHRAISKAEARKFVEFSMQLWSRLRAEAAKGLGRVNKELYEFETSLSSAPGEKYQIDRRHTKLSMYYEFYLKKGRIMGD